MICAKQNLKMNKQDACILCRAKLELLNFYDKYTLKPFPHASPIPSAK